MKVILFVSSACILMSCKMRNISDVKHDFGQTTRGVENFNFEPCEASYESKSFFPKTQEYLQNIAMEIMRNNPQTFKQGSKLDPKHFCIDVKNDPTFNAYAKSTNRHVTFHTGMVKELGSDASVAAVMAHELAHITMLHLYSSHPKFIPNDNTKKDIEENIKIFKQFNGEFTKAEQLRNAALVALENSDDRDESLKLQVEFIGLFDDVFRNFSDRYGNVNVNEFANARNNFLKKIDESKRDSLASKIDQIAKIFLDAQPLGVRLNKLRDDMRMQLLKSTQVGLSEGMNWEEQEADEVGLELYRRAGFRDSHFFDMLFQLAAVSGLSARDIASCMQMSFKAILLSNRNSEPERGAASHPESCWRIFDHQKELMLHKNDYANFPNNKVMLNMNGLADAIQEITAFEDRTNSDPIMEFSPTTPGTTSDPLPNFPSEPSVRKK